MHDLGATSAVSDYAFLRCDAPAVVVRGCASKYPRRRSRGCRACSGDLCSKPPRFPLLMAQVISQSPGRSKLSNAARSKDALSRPSRSRNRAVAEDSQEGLRFRLPCGAGGGAVRIDRRPAQAVRRSLRLSVSPRRAAQRLDQIDRDHVGRVRGRARAHEPHGRDTSTPQRRSPLGRRVRSNPPARQGHRPRTSRRHRGGRRSAQDVSTSTRTFLRWRCAPTAWNACARAEEVDALVAILAADRDDHPEEGEREQDGGSSALLNNGA